LTGPHTESERVDSALELYAFSDALAE